MAQRSIFRKFHQPCLNLLSPRIRKCSTEIGETNENVIAYRSKCVNEVKLLGYVGKTPKQYQTNKSAVTYFSLATSRYYTDKSDTKQTITTWHTIIVRKPSLQDYVLKYISKGTRAYISGYLDDYILDFTDEVQEKSSIHVVAEEAICLRKSQVSVQENSPFFVYPSHNYKVSH